MTYPRGFQVNHGEKLYVVSLSEIQYQTLMGNVQVEPPCTCDGEVWCGFTGLRADNPNSTCIPTVRPEGNFGVRYVFVRMTTAEDRVMRFYVSKKSLKSNLLVIAISAKEENHGTFVDKKVPEDVWPQVSCWTRGWPLMTRTD